MQKLAWALIIVVATVGFAEARPDTRQMTCAQARSLVGEYGAIVLSTGTHTFNRFVRDGRFCNQNDEVIEPQTAPTRDAPRCFVGYVCVYDPGIFDD